MPNYGMRSRRLVQILLVGSIETSRCYGFNSRRAFLFLPTLR